MPDPAADAASSHEADYYQRETVSLAAALAARWGIELHSLDASELAIRDADFARIWRHGQGETEAEEILCRALEMDAISQP